MFTIPSVKYYVNLNPDAHNYLHIVTQLEDGRFMDEISGYHTWDQSSPIEAEGFKEITKDQYDLIYLSHLNEVFDGDWNNYETFILRLLKIQ